MVSLGLFYHKLWGGVVLQFFGRCDGQCNKNYGE